MKLSNFLHRSVKDVNKEEVSKNGQLLIKAGYVSTLMSGVYSYLPIGLRVIKKIEDIVREEMNKVGGRELLMPSLTPRSIWDTTGRYDTIDVLFKLKGAGDKDLVLGATHEEVITPLLQSYITSYKNMPLAAYQIQTKFRNELRAKSGILRGREFKMKDMYSFHTSQEDLDEFYDKVIVAYNNVYNRCGIGDKTMLTFASGGAFSKYSHEFQTITSAGEDIVYKLKDGLAINEEIIDDKEAMDDLGVKDKNKLETFKTVEVGNIFKLGTKYTEAFGLKYIDKDGKSKNPIMGCYGIGISRVMGTIVECLADDRGLVWNKETAPFDIYLIDMTNSNETYEKLIAAGFDVLYDDRNNVSNGEKFANADLLGIPNRVVVSDKTLAEGKIEYKKRTSEEKILVSFEDLVNLLNK